MEKYSEDNNYVQTKLISTFISIVTYLIYNIISSKVNQIIYKNNINKMFWPIVLFISFSEISYYCLKFILIKITENGSVYTNILDIIRRIITLIIGIFIFKDTYKYYIFICFGFLVIGCIFINSSDIINRIFDKIYKKITIKHYDLLPTHSTDTVMIEYIDESKKIDNNTI